MYTRPRGALTEAYIATLNRNPRPSYAQLMQGVRQHLTSNGYDQYPMLTASQQDAPSNAYNIGGGIVPNQNRVVGRIQTRRHFPRKDWADNDPFNEMEDSLPMVAMNLAAFMVADQLGDTLMDG